MKEPNFEVKMNEYLPLRDVVFYTLRQAILKGELKPGERLMELEGLVLMIPRKGAEVAEITEKNLRDVLEVREALEKLAVQLACDQITKAGVRKLREAAEAFEEALTGGNVTEIAEADELSTI